MPSRMRHPRIGIASSTASGNRPAVTTLVSRQRFGRSLSDLRILPALSHADTPPGQIRRGAHGFPVHRKPYGACETQHK